MADLFFQRFLQYFFQVKIHMKKLHEWFYSFNKDLFAVDTRVSKFNLSDIGSSNLNSALKFFSSSIYLLFSLKL